MTHEDLAQTITQLLRRCRIEAYTIRHVQEKLLDQMYRTPVPEEQEAYAQHWAELRSRGITPTGTEK